METKEMKEMIVNKLNVKLSVERTLDNIEDDPLAYCEGLLQSFIHTMIYKLGEDEVAKIMERSGMQTVYSSVVG